jgi:DNA-binding NtrC family response regulator
MASVFKIFIVEDDPWYGQLLEHHLSANPDYELTVFQNAKDLLTNIYLNPDLICMDYGLPDMQGDVLLLEIQKRNNGIPVVVISAQEEISIAVNLLKTGATDYIVKNEYTKKMLWKSILNIRENMNLKKEVESLKEKLNSKFVFDSKIIGESDSIKRCFRLVEKAVQSNINVSLTGETGTGKEVFARAIHQNSDRQKKPFVAVNMAAIPAELAESELFGYEEGSFTGANSNKIGKFEEAEGGILFLDEIGEMPLSLQSKLLRVIQEREVVHIGGSKSIPVNFRLITATHKNLAEEVKLGTFREDLFYRIVGLPIELPPLRHRGKDLFILCKYFIKSLANANKTTPPILSESAQKKLAEYSFPGNIRELKAVIELAFVMCDGNSIKEEDITFYQLSNQASLIGQEKTLKEFEINIITQFLRKYNENVAEVANKLNIGKSKIYAMIKSGEISLN